MAVTVLVSGSTGVLGQELITRLHAAGYIVLTSGRQQESSVDVVWDLAAQDLPETDVTPDIVVHAAAAIGRYRHPVSEALPLFDVNVQGTLRIVRWSVSKKIRRFILVSSASVYGEWQNSPKCEADPGFPWKAGAYAVSKWCSEQVAHLVAEVGCELSILRLSSIYGPAYTQSLIQRFLRTARDEGSLMLQPPFDDAFDLIHVADAAETVLRAVESPQSGLWNVGGTLATIAELASTCARIMKADITFSEGKAERPARILNWVDDEKARRDLGHINIISLESGIVEMARTV